MAGDYIKCPRCELNYIHKDQQYCDVCKAELNLLPDYTFLDDFEEDEMLCPVCHINYITGDEEMCSDCRLARAESINEDDDDSWREFLDEDTELEPETEEEVLLSQLQDEEFGEENDEEENDEYIDDDDIDDLDSLDNLDIDDADDDDIEDAKIIE